MIAWTKHFHSFQLFSGANDAGKFAVPFAFAVPAASVSSASTTPHGLFGAVNPTAKDPLMKHTFTFDANKKDVVTEFDKICAKFSENNNPAKVGSVNDLSQSDKDATGKEIHSCISYNPFRFHLKYSFVLLFQVVPPSFSFAANDKAAGASKTFKFEVTPNNNIFGVGPASSSATNQPTQNRKPQTRIATFKRNK